MLVDLYVWAPEAWVSVAGPHGHWILEQSSGGVEDDSYHPSTHLQEYGIGLVITPPPPQTSTPTLPYPQLFTESCRGGANLQICEILVLRHRACPVQ